MKISVIEDIGKNCITLDAGKKLYDLIYPRLSVGEDVTLNFDGVAVFASPFFNAAIGHLLKDIDADVLNEHLHFESLTSTGLEVLKRVIENSRNYYSNPEAREALNDILKSQSEDK